MIASGNTARPGFRSASIARSTCILPVECISVIFFFSRETITVAYRKRRVWSHHDAARGILIAPLSMELPLPLSRRGEPLFRQIYRECAGRSCQRTAQRRAHPVSPRSCRSVGCFADNCGAGVRSIDSGRIRLRGAAVQAFVSQGWDLLPERHQLRPGSGYRALALLRRTPGREWISRKKNG